jgi:hypothetical protein
MRINACCGTEHVVPVRHGAIITLLRVSIVKCERISITLFGLMVGRRIYCRRPTLAMRWSMLEKDKKQSVKKSAKK